MEALIVLFARLVVGGLFLVAGLRKLRAPGAFERTLLNYEVRSAPVRRGIVELLPPAELLLGASLILGIATQFSAIAAGALLIVFLVAAVRARDGESSCGCMAGSGFLDTRSPAATATRNLALLVLALSAALLPNAVSVESLIAALPALLVALMGTLGVTLIIRDSTEQSAADQSSTRSNLADRREFLGRAARLGVAVSLGILLTYLPRLRSAEAACYGCETCQPEIAFAGCSGQCCAFFWVRDREYCDSFCRSCSAWRLEQFCGVPDCCS